MKTSEKGIALIKEFEGFRAEEYKCSAGVRTIGYGTTRNYPKRAITEQEAHDLLVRDLENMENDLANSIGDILSQNQYDAVMSFVYNLGITNFNGSTLRKKILNNPLDPTIHSEFTKWVYSAGVISQGLVRRRTKEAHFYFA